MRLILYLILYEGAHSEKSQSWEWILPESRNHSAIKTAIFSRDSITQKTVLTDKFSVLNYRPKKRVDRGVSVPA